MGCGVTIVTHRATRPGPAGTLVRARPVPTHGLERNRMDPHVAPASAAPSNGPAAGKGATPRAPRPGPESPEDRPARLAVGVVGAGRVGTALGAALARAGHRVVAAAAVSERSRSRVEERLPGAAVAPPPEVVARRRPGAADRSRRRARPSWSAGLVVTGRRRRRASCWCTPAAGTATGVLDPATRAGALPLALHPVMTFTGTPGRPATASPASRSASPRPSRCARSPRRWSSRWAASRSGSPRTRARSTTRRSPGGANHLVTLVVEAMDLLAAAGVAEPGRMLGPLLGAALDNAPAPRHRRAHRAGRPRRRGHGRPATSTSSPSISPEAAAPTSRWPGSPPTGPSPPACSGPRTPNACSTRWPTDLGRDRAVGPPHRRARAGRHRGDALSKWRALS